jgi:uncharacterized protein (DUF983 family)
VSSRTSNAPTKATDESAAPSAWPRPDGTKLRHHPPHRRFSARNGLPATLLITITAAAVIVGVRPVDEQSAWLHLAVGRFLAGGGRFGVPDPWSSGATTPYRSTEALPALVSYRTFELFGLGGVAWLRAVGILALLAVLLWGARRVADPVPALLATGAGLLGAGHALTARPQLLGLVLLAVTVVAWHRTATDLRPRWWLVSLGWAAAWVHGLWFVDVLVGLATVAGLVAGRRVTARQTLRLAAVPLLAAGAAGLTSFGPGLLLTPFTVGRSVRDFVGEWQATSAHDLCAMTVLVCIGLVATAWMRSSTPPPWWQVVHLTLAAVLTLSMSRLIAVGAVLVAPLLAEALQRQRRSRAERVGRRERGTAVLALTAAALVAAPLSWANASQPAGVPKRLSSTLGQIPPGSTMLAQGDMSSWLLWSQPQVKLVFDSRSEIYSRRFHLDFARMMAAAPGWDRVLSDTGATYALVPQDSPIAAALVERQQWSSLGSDAGYVLLEAAP